MFYCFDRFMQISDNIFSKDLGNEISFFVNSTNQLQLLQEGMYFNRRSLNQK